MATVHIYLNIDAGRIMKADILKLDVPANIFRLQSCPI